MWNTTDGTGLFSSREFSNSAWPGSSLAGPGVFGGESACFRMQMPDKRNKRRWNPKSRCMIALFTSLLRSSKYRAINTLFVLHVIEENKCVCKTGSFFARKPVSKKERNPCLWKEESLNFTAAKREEWTCCGYWLRFGFSFQIHGRLWRLSSWYPVCAPCSLLPETLHWESEWRSMTFLLSRWLFSSLSTNQCRRAT